MVMVGATNVGHTSAQYDSTLRTTVQNRTVEEYITKDKSFQVGQWINTFHLGSTVIY